MREFTIKNVTFGLGIPKICAPLVAHTKDETLKQLNELLIPEIDLVEWRMDYLDCVHNEDAMLAIAKEIRSAISNKPILATFRTKQEGGEQDFPMEEYFHLCQSIAESGFVDLIDLELFSTEDTDFLFSLCETIHKAGVKIIFSNHDFQKTPEQSHIVTRLEKMESLGADIAKIAVMPNSSDDVLTLLNATNLASKTLQVPIVTMSMGKLGVISRLCGATFGSAMTFGSLSQASAPGQVPVRELSSILHTIGSSNPKI